MPNSKGGKKFKKGKKNRTFDEKKELILKNEEDSQEYAQVINPLGNGRFELTCFDGGKTRTGSVCGTMRKRIWINRSDLVLISKWEGMTDDKKCSIIHKYSEDESKRLLKEGHIPSTFKFNLDELFDNHDDSGFIIDQPSDSESSEEDIDLDEI